MPIDEWVAGRDGTYFLLEATELWAKSNAKYLVICTESLAVWN